MKQFPVVAISSLTLVSMMFSACETETPGRGAAHGAMAGAVIGAIAGGNIRSAAIGAAAGAAAGAVVGKVIQDERREHYPGYEEDRYYGAYGERPVHRYRVARLTNRPGYVQSPYSPYALVDVRGIRPGARVLDPASNRVFVNP